MPGRADRQHRYEGLQSGHARLLRPPRRSPRHHHADRRAGPGLLLVMRGTPAGSRCPALPLIALTLDPFLMNNEEQRRSWRSLLLAIEQRLVLAGKYPGMLADYLT